MIGFIRHYFIDPFEIVLRKLTQLDYPTYFSELSDEHDDADPIEFDGGKLLFGKSCFIDGHGGASHQLFGLFHNSLPYAPDNLTNASWCIIS